jgi:hypothetical protein
MTGEHTKRLAESTGDDLTVLFSPEVTHQFSRLEASVSGSEHFSPEIYWTSLQDIIEKKPVTVRDAIFTTAVIVREAEKHIQATGDKKAAEALSALLDCLSQTKASSRPLSVTSRAPVYCPPFNGR